MQSGAISPIEAVAYSSEFMKSARELGKVNNARAAFAIASQWLVIGLMAAIAVRAASIPVYLLAIVVISTRQQALASLMHEATHGRLNSNRFLNDFLANLFCALPTGLSLSRYSDEHVLHHRAPNTDDDPYWRIFQANPKAWNWPKTRTDGWRLLISDMTGLNTLMSGREISNWLPWRNHFSRRSKPVPLPLMERALVYALYLSIAVALTILHAWLYFVVLWILPFLTLTQIFVRLRAIAEHSALEVKDGTAATRHVDAHWLESLTICPFNINYHLVHHIFPYIPYYNLPRMHALLMANPEFRRLAHVSKTYLGPRGVIRGELMKPVAA
ncbi:MAG: fatty acid desaturase family protein [Alphaproteobacteria bacterium]|nr:fatty acid desaturase family protein [Alphaproteobacteria bacterium]